ncbi:MAG: MBL fold metallo-hydrolase [Rhodospirillaceae bacterium]|nr:MBL fold metallo-hydrolase [Rhodospirillaceae bacterium]
MDITRRTLLSASSGFLAASLGGASSLLAQPAPAALGRDRLVLLGTKGGPSVWNDLQTPSCNMIVYDGVPYVIDAGYGVTQRLLKAKVSLATLKHIFITHHHSDHNLELGVLMYNAWVNGLEKNVDVYGPPGIDNLISSFWESNRIDIDTRIVDEGRPDVRKLVTPKTYGPGVVMSVPGVKVSALRNVHPPMDDSFALKFELGSKTIVFSGDTAYFPPLADFAKGADILVHEVMYGPAIENREKLNPNAPAIVSHLKAAHTLAEDVGRIATKAKVKKLVLNHFVPPMNPELTPEVWTKAVASTYAGDIVVGRDLMEIPLAP